MTGKTSENSRQERQQLAAERVAEDLASRGMSGIDIQRAVEGLLDAFSKINSRYEYQAPSSSEPERLTGHTAR